ncbi:MAG: hypothetical protein IJ171_06500 [Ruminococcus sp.]|nr:hypothetical protein [Ruminococcus sp.]
MPFRCCGGASLFAFDEAVDFEADDVVEAIGKEVAEGSVIVDEAEASESFSDEAEEKAATIADEPVTEE